MLTELVKNIFGQNLQFTRTSDFEIASEWYFL